MKYFLLIFFVIIIDFQAIVHPYIIKDLLQKHVFENGLVAFNYCNYDLKILKKTL